MFSYQSIIDLIEVTHQRSTVLLACSNNQLAVIRDPFSDDIRTFLRMQLGKMSKVNRIYFVEELGLLLVCDISQQLAIYSVNYFDTVDMSITYLTNIGEQQGHQNRVQSLLVDTGHMVLLTGGKKVMCVWDIRDLVGQKTVRLLYSVTDNLGMINQINFSGSKLLSVSCDSSGAVIVLDANRQVVINRFVAHARGCNGSELDEADGTLVTWGEDQLIKVWRLWEGGTASV